MRPPYPERPRPARGRPAHAPHRRGAAQRWRPGSASPRPFFHFSKNSHARCPRLSWLRPRPSPALPRISEPAGGWPSFLSPSFSFLGDFIPRKPGLRAAPGPFWGSGTFKGFGTRQLGLFQPDSTRWPGIPRRCAPCEWHTYRGARHAAPLHVHRCPWESGHPGFVLPWRSCESPW